MTMDPGLGSTPWMSNVVFPTGMVHNEESGELRLYYGAGDSVVALATANLDELLDYLWQYG